MMHLKKKTDQEIERGIKHDVLHLPVTQALDNSQLLRFHEHHEQGCILYYSSER
jgi:hypothetical protein